MTPGVRGRPLWGVPALRYVALALAVSCGGGSPSTPPGKVQGHRTKVAELADVVEPTLWRELTGLLKARDFAALDRRLGGFQEAYEADHLKEPEVLRAYGALASPDLALLPFYNEWVEKVPSSYSAHACRGLVESQLAWKRRGSAIAAKTTNEQWLGSAELAASSRADLMRAVELRPKLMPALKPLITLAMLGGPESPQEAYERAIAVDPDSYAARAAYIIALQPKWGGSLEAIQNVVDGMKEAEQHNPSLHSLHGSVAWARGGMMEWDNKPREALDQYQEAFRSGDCARFHEARGNVYKWLGIYRKAVPDFDSILAWTPHDSDALANRGLCYYKLDLYDRAMRDLSLALEIDPTNADALKYRGYTSCKKRDWDAALKDYDLALQYEPTWVFLLADSGAILLEEKHDYKGAAERLGRALHEGGESSNIPNTWYRHGKALYFLKDEHAAESFKIYLSDPVQDGNHERQDWIEAFLAREGASRFDGTLPQPPK